MARLGDDPAGLAGLIVNLHADPDASEQAGRDGVRLVAQEFCAKACH